ncbi:MAG: MFS transporter [Prosthecobacter sp.]|nr:MFS transporter [Prosthecobacter sp.]
MHPNIRLFIWFRLLFNCRLYYPVFTVLFLDLGLSIAEFAALNVIWAITIVLLEVPSGAIADQFGRRFMIVISGWLMVAEMATLCLMPVGNHDAVLWLFVLNRILSGAAEACASGADEALAYDSLPEADRSTLWSRVMAQLSRGMAIGFIISSISGSILYDHGKVTAFLAAFGIGSIDRAVTMKIPLVLNLLTGIACLLVTLRMTEVVPAGAASRGRGTSILQDTLTALRGIGSAARWIWHTHAALTLMVFGVVFDSIIRLFLTVSSNFYRLVGIPEAWYGVIATVAALLGLLTAGLMERLSERHTAAKNFAWLAVVTFASLQFAAHPQHGWLGVALIMPLMLGMRFLQFFLSYYLNAVVDSGHRATVLSFRGMSMNLAYGAMTLLFGLHSHWLEGRLHLKAEDPRVFAASLTWWPWWFAATVLAAALWLRLRMRKG